MDTHTVREVPGADDFPAMLKEVLKRHEMSYGQLAKELAALGFTRKKDTVALWANGTQAPRPYDVFAIEQVLGEEPGTLSRTLGYVPAEAVPAVSVPEAIAADPQLSPKERAMLIAMYEAARAGEG